MTMGVAYHNMVKVWILEIQVLSFPYLGVRTLFQALSPNKLDPLQLGDTVQRQASPGLGAASPG